MTNIIKVPLANKHRYNIHVGQSLESDIINFFDESYSPNRAFIIIDEKVRALHGEYVERLANEYFSEVHLLAVPEGETSKSVTIWQKLIDNILSIGIERSTPIIAVGGGVVGDLAGFVAAVLLRGLPLVHMPTSLLAMVDSSIGGKTGINHPSGKNLVGAFYQPDAVFTDISFLKTLDEKEWITGIAEILKYAAIRKPSFFSQLESLINEPWSPNKEWLKLITESVRIKADIVQKDALEKGTRAYLNFGHTFGHALEKVAGYGEISHGEAVFVGMMAATYFSRQLGYPVDESRFKPFLNHYRKQIHSLSTDTRSLIKAMQSDKKVKNNTLRLVLLNGWGSPYIFECDSPSILNDIWQHTIEQFN